MQPRLDYAKASPGAFRAMLALSKYTESCGLERSLLELLKTRASQINGCAYCIDMHTQDASANGETEQRLHALNAWREHRSSLTASGPPWPGPKPSPVSARVTRLTTSSSRRARSSPMRNW